MDGDGLGGGGGSANNVNNGEAADGKHIPTSLTSCYVAWFTMATDQDPVLTSIPEKIKKEMKRERRNGRR